MAPASRPQRHRRGFSYLIILAVATVLACLSARLAVSFPLPPDQPPVLAMEVAQGLEAAHPLNRSLTDSRISNPTAYITSQCYTKTVDDQGNIHNPCYSCHINSTRPNYINDYTIQTEYSFPTVATQNPWRNLFVDRSRQIDAISDEAMLAYIRQDNYRDGAGHLILREKLDRLPADWDLDQDGVWDGYRPDAYFQFDEQGFDRAPDGTFTGWRAFAYYPFLGTFWPTNGSTDDVLIRLAEPLQQNEAGDFDREVYQLNLAIAEAMVKRQNIAIAPTDERTYQVDLDRDGRLAIAHTLRYDWAPTEGRDMSYVGRAKHLQEQGSLHLAAGLFPEGTEFLHSVRYIDTPETGGIALAPRMKELRYAQKGSWYNYTELRQIARREVAENLLNPDAVKEVPGDMERGLFSQGWRYQGFIEDAAGQLRPQSKEETLFCMGCHSGLGATTDTIFSFPRKLDTDAFRNGWYHWTAQGLEGLPEPRLVDGTYEYAQYLEANHAGDEFRENQEVMAKFFNANGTLKSEAIAHLHTDIGTLLLPSPERALELNKAYRAIVQEQSFIYGRDATRTPVKNVHQQVEQDQPTEVELVLAP